MSVSASGVALTGTPTSAELPKVGGVLGLTLQLPWTPVPIRTAVRIEWVQPRGSDMILGASFSTLSALQTELIADYVESYRPSLALLNAHGDDLPILRPLSRDYSVYPLASLAELFEDGRSYAVVVLCGSEAELAQATLEVLAGHWFDTMASLNALRRVALEPRVVLYANAQPSQVVDLFNRGKIFRSVVPGDESGLAQAIQEAVADFTVRSEMQKMVGSLARVSVPVVGSPPEKATPTGLIYESAEMNQVMSLVERVARFSVPVLITGETGSGKELLARAIHALSPRSSRTFVAQDCGAVPETLLESELFGHVKGAFTGAVANHPGLFAIADGGTIFLDEIENISHVFQSKLLRVLEGGEIRPVGGSSFRTVNVRVLVATNRALLQEVAAGRFRADLFYRLDRFTIEMPPLRERPADILPLARHFLVLLAGELGVIRPTLAPEVEQQLLAHDWPGNVRELRNLVERAILLAQPESVIRLDALPAQLARQRRNSPEPEGSLRERLAALEQRLLADAINRHQGIISRAARELKMDPVTLSRRARALGVPLGSGSKSR